MADLDSASESKIQSSKSRLPTSNLTFLDPKCERTLIFGVVVVPLVVAIVKVEVGSYRFEDMLNLIHESQVAYPGILTLEIRIGLGFKV